MKKLRSGTPVHRLGPFVTFKKAKNKEDPTRLRFNVGAVKTHQNHRHEKGLSPQTTKKRRSRAYIERGRGGREQRHEELLQKTVKEKKKATSVGTILTRLTSSPCNHYYRRCADNQETVTNEENQAICRDRGGREVRGTIRSIVRHCFSIRHGQST